jgi:hypothetical protein
MVFRRIEYWIEGDRGAQILVVKTGMSRIEKKGLNDFFNYFFGKCFLAYLSVVTSCLR